jgi:hypothetical protein
MQTEEQLLRNKIEYLEDRMKVMEKSLSDDREQWLGLQGYRTTTT